MKEPVEVLLKTLLECLCVIVLFLMYGAEFSIKTVKSVQQRRAPTVVSKSFLIINPVKSLETHIFNLQGLHTGSERGHCEVMTLQHTHTNQYVLLYTVHTHTRLAHTLLFVVTKQYLCCTCINIKHEHTTSSSHDGAYTALSNPVNRGRGCCPVDRSASFNPAQP